MDQADDRTGSGEAVVEAFISSKAGRAIRGKSPLSKPSNIQPQNAANQTAASRFCQRTVTWTSAGLAYPCQYASNNAGSGGPSVTTNR